MEIKTWRFFLTPVRTVSQWKEIAANADEDMEKGEQLSIVGVSIN